MKLTFINGKLYKNILFTKKEIHPEEIQSVVENQNATLQVKLKSGEHLIFDDIRKIGDVVEYIYQNKVSYEVTKEGCRLCTEREVYELTKKYEDILKREFQKYVQTHFGAEYDVEVITERDRALVSSKIRLIKDGKGVPVKVYGMNEEFLDDVWLFHLAKLDSVTYECLYIDDDETFFVNEAEVKAYIKNTCDDAEILE